MTLLTREAAFMWLADEFARGIRHTLLEPCLLGGYLIHELKGPLRERLGEPKRP